MNSGFSIKTIAWLFLAVLALYLGCFYGLEHLRHRHGGWVVDFQATAQGFPALVVSQPHASLTNLTLVLRGEQMTNGPGHVAFDRVKQPVPFGRVLYEDLTFLPGVVTLDLYVHEVELLPRVLIANKREIPWQSWATIDLWPSNKPATPPQPPKARRP